MVGNFGFCVFVGTSLGFFYHRKLMFTCFAEASQTKNVMFDQNFMQVSGDLIGCP